jgi:predicted metal-dependent enzyme (double-stranded beta helix superfamily)
MAYTLDQFCTDSHDLLLQGSDDAQLTQIKSNLVNLLNNPDFVSETYSDDTPIGKRVLYHDTDTDFYVLAHVQAAGKSGNPHSHGTAWAIYGNITGATNITIWRRANAADADHAELEVADRHTITPGTAQVYGPGAIHSTQHPEKAWVIRITGCDLDHMPRYRFDPKKDKILAEA